MSIVEVQAVIDSAKARGTGSLERLIRERMPEATPEQVDEATVTAVELIEAIPVFLARARQEARERNMVMLVQPLLERAEEYFLSPMDLVPEMTRGLAGLLDDAYLVLRVLQNLDRGPGRFLDWDLEYPVTFIRGLLGTTTSRRLDALSIAAMEEVGDGLSDMWHHMSHEA